MKLTFLPSVPKQRVVPPLGSNVCKKYGMYFLCARIELTRDSISTII